MVEERVKPKRRTIFSQVGLAIQTQLEGGSCKSDVDFVVVGRYLVLLTRPWELGTNLNSSRVRDSSSLSPLTIMPAPTRQATPGPSTILQPHTTQSVNSRKRAATEPGVEERDTKKPRADAPTIGDVNGAKDKKRKKRKKKRRTSVVLQDPPMEHRRVRSGSRSLAPLSAASTIVSQRATPNAEPVASAVPGTPNREILAEEEEEEPVLSVRTLLLDPILSSYLSYIIPSLPTKGRGKRSQTHRLLVIHHNP